MVILMGVGTVSQRASFLVPVIDQVFSGGHGALHAGPGWEPACWEERGFMG